jgi:hypothetical protein
MFHTFSSEPPDTSPSKRKRKRAKVTRACDYCREHRVRCDIEAPCSRCLENKIKCSLSLQSSQDHERPHNPSTELLSTYKPVAWPITRSMDSSPSKLEEIDSTVGFMSRINAFCSSIEELSSESDVSPPPYSSVDRPLVLDPSKHTAPKILKDQALHLLDVYWTRFHHLNPILNRSTIDALCEALKASDTFELHGVPLVDGIIAFSLRHLYSSGMNGRLLGLTLEREGSSLVHFQRCLSTTSQDTVFAEPSLERIQCYVLMTLYLLDAGQHQTAYNMIGLALRNAHLLNLQRGLSETDPDMHLARRIWWTVVHLDFRCARLLGCPMGVQLTETTCPLPDCHEYAYSARAVALTKTTLAMTEILSNRLCQPHQELTLHVESCADALSAEMYRLWEWRDQQLNPNLQRPLHVQHARSDDWIHAAIEANPTQLLHETLLKMQYYNEIIGLHRPFIRFPNRSLLPQRSPKADAHGTTALTNSMATVDLAHRIMSTTDMLYGCCQLYQWQWNALLTLIGFVMAHPLCIYASSARQHAQLALEIFSAADPKNLVASRAAALTRSLCAKVDSLVQMLKPDNQPVTIPDDTEIQANENVDEPGDSTEPSNFNSDALWSWTDMADPDAWTAYSDGITGVLADFPDLPFGNDGFLSGPG